MRTPTFISVSIFAAISTTKVVMPAFVTTFASVVVFALPLITNAPLAIAAPQDLAAIAKEGNKAANAFARNEGSSTYIPHHSKENTNKIASDLASKTDIQLKQEADAKIADADQNKGDTGAIVVAKTTKRKPLDNYDTLAMFKRAKNIFDDPLKAYNKMSEESCKEILLDPKNQYRKRVIKEKKQDTEYEEQICFKPNEEIMCEKYLNVVCAKKEGECDGGGIERNSVASDMQFSYIYPELTIGTIADNYWGSGVYERLTKFNIKNLKDIKEFILTTVGFDDHMLIKVNGNTIYVGPDGGNQLTYSGWGGVYNGIRGLTCELGRNWQFHPNIDLKPYLKEGLNEIWTKTIVCGVGEGWMKIRARQHCCSEFLDVWTTRCFK